MQHVETLGALVAREHGGWGFSMTCRIGRPWL
jgi:hypothetical protein